MPYWLERTLAVALVVALLFVWSLYHRRWAEREAARIKSSKEETDTPAG